MNSKIIASDFKKQGNNNQCMNCASSTSIKYMAWRCTKHNKTVQFDSVCGLHKSV